MIQPVFEWNIEEGLYVAVQSRISSQQSEEMQENARVRRIISKFEPNLQRRTI